VYPPPILVKPTTVVICPILSPCDLTRPDPPPVIFRPTPAPCDRLPRSRPTSISTKTKSDNLAPSSASLSLRLAVPPPLALRSRFPSRRYLLHFMLAVAEDAVARVVLWSPSRSSTSSARHAAATSRAHLTPPPLYTPCCCGEG